MMHHRPFRHKNRESHVLFSMQHSLLAATKDYGSEQIVIKTGVLLIQRIKTGTKHMGITAEHRAVHHSVPNDLVT